MSTPEQPSPAPQPQQTTPGNAPQIDVHKLADKVYRLLLNDLRLERARGTTARGRRR